MISRKKQQFAIRSSLIIFSLFSGGCSTLFERAEDTSDKAQNPASQTVSKGSESTEEKDARIRDLERTVSTMTAKVEELETQVRAKNNPPPMRQNFDSPKIKAGSAPKPQIYGSDPEKGFNNDSGVQSFRQGKALFDSDRYPEAILGFSAFLETFPRHPIADQAQYFLAESYYRQGEYRIAEQEFQKLIQTFERSSRVADSYAKLALCSQKIGNASDAERYRTQLDALFPSSPAARDLKRLWSPNTGIAIASPTNTNSKAKGAQIQAPTDTVKPIESSQSGTTTFDTIPTADAPSSQPSSAPTSESGTGAAPSALDAPPTGGAG